MKKYFVFFLMLQLFLIRSMDQSLDTRIALTPLEIIADLVISTYSDFLDHKTICSFAAINKAYNKKTLTSSEERKKLFIKSFPEKYSFIKTLWHRYGSACVTVASEIHKNSFFFEHRVLNGHDVISKEKQALFDSFYKYFPFKVRELTHQPFPFIEEKKVYFYGFSEQYVIDARGIMTGSLEIKRYGFDGSIVKCYLSVSNVKIPLAHLEEERYISILNHPQIIKEIKNNCLLFREPRLLKSKYYTEEYEQMKLMRLLFLMGF